MNNAVIAVSVCLCGGLGAAARYVCDSVIKASWHKAFPLSTFVINSIAGFLAGVIQVCTHAGFCRIPRM